MKKRPTKYKKFSTLAIDPELKSILDVYCDNTGFYRTEVVNRIFTILYQIWDGNDEEFKDWLRFDQVHSDKK